MENMENYNEALAALKAEYEEKLNAKEAECALLRQKEKAIIAMKEMNLFKVLSIRPW